MRPELALALLLTALPSLAQTEEPDPLPKVAEGWSIELIARAPTILYPTAVVVAPDSTIYLGQDPMDMPGPPTSPIDSVVALKGGKVTVFADHLWSVMGLEWAGDTLYVVHAPYLSAFRDKDGDGKADERVDLVTGLGPKLPGFNGINDHVASGVRMGMDGFLYVSVGDKGIPRAIGRDGASISMSSGGVIRVRPDGSGLEVVSTGERNPLSVALTTTDEILTYGNDDDSKKWPNSLTHHVVGGHYGYPYEFLTAPYRALPIVAGQVGGSGAQGVCYNDDGLPTRFRGDLFFCDWGLQAIHRYKVAREGGTFALVKREAIVERGPLADFRPFSIATSGDGRSFVVVDWAYNGWLSPTAKTGRLYRLTYQGPDAVTPKSRPIDQDIPQRIEGLDHPSMAARLDSQRFLSGQLAVGPLVARLKSEPILGRRHALWALDAINTDDARRAIRACLLDAEPSIRLEAARSSGVRRDRQAVVSLIPLLRDTDPTIRREAAIALGRVGDGKAGAALYAALGDPDDFVAWSVRHAIRALNAWDSPLLTPALLDPNRREDALKLADESWSVPAVKALVANLESSPDAEWRGRVVAALAGLYHRYPPWSGQWFGTNPLAGAFPRKTEDWSPEGMDGALMGMSRGLRDDDAAVRRQAIIGLYQVGPRASSLLRVALDREGDAVNLAALAQAVGAFGDAKAVPSLVKIVQDAKQSVEVRATVLEVLTQFRDRAATNARMMLLYRPDTPEALVAQALPPLGQGRLLPINDLAGFLDHKAEGVRAAALRSFPNGKPLPDFVRSAIVSRLDDPSIPVRQAAITAIAAHQITQATPRLIDRAQDEATRLEATLALASMPDARALPVYIAAIQDRDPALRKAGEGAMLAIRDAAAPELERQAKLGKFQGVSALAVERILTRFQPLTAWKTLGPMPRTTAFLFPDSATIDFGKAQVGAEGRSIVWQTRQADRASGRVVIDDLKGGGGDRGGFGYDINGSPDLAAFAYAEVTADADRPALMLVGSSGSIVVMINNQTVLNVANSAGRAFAIDSDLVRFSLRKGVNRVLVLTRQGVGTWSFGVQISEASSPQLAGLTTGPVGVETLRAFALSHPGSAQNGETLFFDAKGVGCVKCHAAGGRGTAQVGPDLTGLVLKYDKAEVVKSVLEPSNRLATGYQPWLLARHDGTVLTGLLRTETDTYLELADAEGKLFRVPKADIETRKLSEVSMMPAGLVDPLTPAEFADLIAYLMSLKGPR